MPALKPPPQPGALTVATDLGELAMPSDGTRPAL